MLSEQQRNFFKRILNRESSQGDCAESILNLSSWLNQAYGKPAYILLDEYDTPLQAAYIKNYYDEIIDFIRSFMVQTFKDNPHLKQAVVIGILKVAQESIFSDFNNPKVSTLVDPALKDCFGFTEEEVKKMLTHFSLEKEMEQHKRVVQRLHIWKRHRHLQPLEHHQLLKCSGGRPSPLLGEHQ